MENATEILHINKMPKRIPTNGTFELTVRCNLSCKMCMFRHDDKENSELIAKELTTEQWIDMAKQAAEAGTLQLLITGGEPMLRPDFCEIWEGIYKLGFVLELYTNATLVTPKIMETLQKYPPHMIGVTIYGASPETYGKVCGNKSMFKKTIEGIKMLQNLPSVIQYRTTIIKDNFEDLSKMEQLLQTELHTDEVLTNSRIVTKAVRGACADVESCRLTAAENLELTINRSKQSLRKKYDVQDEECFKFVFLPSTKNKQLTLLGCQAGMSSYCITWNGMLQGCQILELFAINAAENGFQKAWEEFPFQVKLPPQNPKCNKCEVKEVCECCYAFRYSETGDLQGIPEYICENTQIVSEKLGGKKYENRKI